MKCPTADSRHTQENAMQLKAGMRLRSATCTTEVIVVKTAADACDIRCGGEPMTDLTRTAEALPVQAEYSRGTLVGKRYGDDTLELLCTKPGEGSLSIGETHLEVKGAKALPSSD
jgi:hypothetical protein